MVLFRRRALMRRVFQVVLVNPSLRLAVGDAVRWRRPLASSLLLGNRLFVW